MHGGDLVAARQMFPDAPEPFIDLSTGINPHPYPLPPLPADIFSHLPDRAAIRGLAAVAAQYYGAPSAAHVVPAPGVQILIPKIAALVAPGRAAILGPTYAEHLRAARLAGHDAAEVSDIAQLRGADLAIVVNPNNPDGRIVSRTALLELADDLRRHGGVLVVDESFADVAPDGVSLAGDAGDNIVVLRSFGKFFGLAGLRLGFALAAPDIADRLDAVARSVGRGRARHSHRPDRPGGIPPGKAGRANSWRWRPACSIRCSPALDLKSSAALRCFG